MYDKKSKKNGFLVSIHNGEQTTMTVIFFQK